MFPYTLYCAHREMFEFIIQGHSAHSWLIKTPRNTQLRTTRDSYKGKIRLE